MAPAETSRMTSQFRDRCQKCPHRATSPELIGLTVTPIIRFVTRESEQIYVVITTVLVPFFLFLFGGVVVAVVVVNDACSFAYIFLPLLFLFGFVFCLCSFVCLFLFLFSCTSLHSLHIIINFTFVCMPGVCIYVDLLKN